MLAEDQLPLYDPLPGGLLAHYQRAGLATVHVPARDYQRPALSDVQLEGLVPAALRDCGPDEFLERLPEFDEPMAARLKAARDRNRVLRYVGSLDAATGKASVGLVELERSHTFANINLTDNVVRFLTRRYNENPLVVQGPGAGPEVTAGGIFADLLRVCAYLGARL